MVNRNAMVPKPGTLMKVPTTATAQLVPLPVSLRSWLREVWYCVRVSFPCLCFALCCRLLLSYFVLEESSLRAGPLFDTNPVYRDLDPW